MARLIDADKFRQWWLENGENEYVYDTNSVLDSIDNWPTFILSQEPLTLEQLREMDGKPVWCEWLLPEDRKVETGGWFIVVKGEKGLEIKRPLDFGSHVCKNENYGTGWLAYPYPLPHIDREAWEPCEWCGSVGKKPDNWVCSLEDDNGHTVTNDHMVVCATANYCPSCGRPLTEEAWADLERRLRK